MADYLLEGITDQGEISEEASERVMDSLKDYFRPEFLNRIDEIVLYKPLSKKDITAIINLMLMELQARLDDRRLQLTLTDRAKAHIVDEGYDPVYGARPLKRYLQRNVETMLGKAIIAGDLQEGQQVTIDYVDNRLEFI